MLTWFPTPYPDELLYSILARYHVRSGNISAKVTVEELYGKRTIRSVWDLPANLNALSSKLGGFWSVENIINNHTMYPYYAAFLLPKQAEKVKKSMENDTGGTIHTRTGVSASNIKPKRFLWTCSSCISEDLERYGETYWRRSHQMPGVFICTKHEMLLEETIVPMKPKNQHEFIVATPEIVRKRLEIKHLSEADLQVLIEVANQSALLGSNYKIQNRENEIREKYQGLLKQRDLKTPKGFTNREKLYQEFKAIFSNDVLNLLQSNVTFKETDWLTMIFQKHRKTFHPLRHVLLLIFFETDVNSFYSLKHPRPFGNGPWLCLNVACGNYHKRVVTSLTITSCYDTGKPVGTFKCDCGFVFSRKGPDSSSNDKYKVGTIKEYGFAWKQQLTSLVENQLPLNTIAKTLQCNTETVKKYAYRLGLDVPWKRPRDQRRLQNLSVNPEDQLKRMKSLWLKTRQKYPEKSKTEVRKLVPAVYAYLYRNDREWLNKNAPAKQKVRTVNNRVDWGKRDKELLQLVQEVIENWDNGEQKPSKITIASVGRKLNKVSLLQKKANKLPKTMEYLYQNVEGIATFQKRRVDSVIKQLERENMPIVEWKVYKKAGLANTVSNEVRRYISLRMMEYESEKRTIDQSHSKYEL
ncbi:TnsD family Tn7-like transposition protein [Bacillus sp. N1-1]|uniref:TnsD family Tn7-like transposition protein n=1 Tax=Bacillus sp. N1-1 TaxID=2682541 RepID=UPI00135A7346|nr:TnsD family Tn7-like transposition protein [Bacillus sp. N1-1]